MASVFVQPLVSEIVNKKSVVAVKFAVSGFEVLAPEEIKLSGVHW